MDCCVVWRLLNSTDRTAQKNQYAFWKTKSVSRKWKEHEIKTDCMDNEHCGRRLKETQRNVLAHSGRNFKKH